MDRLASIARKRTPHGRERCLVERPLRAVLLLLPLVPRGAFLLPLAVLPLFEGLLFALARASHTHANHQPECSEANTRRLSHCGEFGQPNDAKSAAPASDTSSVGRI